jgi:hypothetical protein
MWEPALVRDAEAAAKGLQLQKKPRPVDRSQQQRVHNATVTAACAAGLTGDVFIGFADGEVVHLNPQAGTSRLQIVQQGSILGLSVNDRADLLVVVDNAIKNTSQLRSYNLKTKRWMGGHLLREDAPHQLTPVSADHTPTVGYWNGQSLEYLRGPDLLSESGSLQTFEDFRMALLLPITDPGSSQALGSTVVFDDCHVSFAATESSMLAGCAFPPPSNVDASSITRLPWQLGQPQIATLPLSWLPPQGRFLEIAGVTASGALGWAIIRLWSAANAIKATQQTVSDQPFLCATLITPNLVAGVQHKGVSWFRMDEYKHTLIAEDRTSLHDAVACFASIPTRELIIICREGDVVFLPFPE